MEAATVTLEVLKVLAAAGGAYVAVRVELYYLRLALRQEREERRALADRLHRHIENHPGGVA